MTPDDNHDRANHTATAPLVNGEMRNRVQGLRLDSQLAQRAKEALSNPALTAAFDRYRERVIDLLEAADDKDQAQVQILRCHLRSLKVVKRNLEMMVADGIEAESKLDFERQTLAKRFKRVING